LSDISLTFVLEVSWGTCTVACASRLVCLYSTTDFPGISLEWRVYSTACPLTGVNPDVLHPWVSSRNYLAP
jgi:hypothetical protein